VSTSINFNPVEFNGIRTEAVSDSPQRFNQITLRQMQTLALEPVRLLPAGIGKEDQA